MSYKKKEHGGERRPSTVQMKWLPCRVLTDHSECWWTRLTTRLLLGSRLWGTIFSSPESGKLTVCGVADCQALPQGSVSKNVISWPWWRHQPPGMGRKPRTQGHGGNKVLKLGSKLPSPRAKLMLLPVSFSRLLVVTKCGSPRDGTCCSVICWYKYTMHTSKWIHSSIFVHLLFLCGENIRNSTVALCGWWRAGAIQLR